jgi:hypothetical protein
MKFYMPTIEADDWKKQLADPEKQWRAGYSAYALAHAWEDASNFPPEVQAIFSGTIFDECVPLLGLPEHKVKMPAKGRASQNDLFVVARTTQSQLVSIMVEGKVTEAFGEQLSKWYDESDNKTKRLHGILDIINLPHTIPPSIRYQLLHRTASAIEEAKRFNTKYAIMFVHSFSQTNEHFIDYQEFINLYGIQNVKVGQLVKLTTIQNIELYSAWACGDKQYLQEQKI